MRLRTFNAPTLDEAMTLVREALGEEAVIVSTYQSRRGRGAQITAALEDAADEEALAQIVASEEDGVEPEDDIARIVAFHRFERTLGQTIAREARRSKSDDAATALSVALEKTLSFGALPVAAEQPVMLVGPPGSGKTVTAVKLAARAVLAGRRVHLLTTDTVRSGAYEQLAASAEMMDVPLSAVDTPDDLAHAIDDNEEADLVVVDTPGCNAFAPAEIADVKRFADAIAAFPVLVLAAGGDCADLTETSVLFAEAGARALHTTRLDCARRYGGMIAAATAGGLTLAEASATPFIANGLSPLSPSSLARLLAETAFKVGERARRRAATS